MKIQNTLVYNIRGRSQRYFAHVTTVSLSWRVQNIVVIGRIYLKLERSEFSSNFEFDRNMLSGTGAWTLQYILMDIVIIDDYNVSKSRFFSWAEPFFDQDNGDIAYDYFNALALSDAITRSTLV